MCVKNVWHNFVFFGGGGGWGIREQQRNEKIIVFIYLFLTAT